jgi:NAD(P)H dehydrogenase (quinone)
MESIFITGATGNIGSHLVKLLLRDSEPFTAGLKREPETNPPYAYRVFDFNDKQSMTDTFRGFHTLFLILPVADHILEMGQNALEAAMDAGIQHIVHSSAAGANPDSEFPLLRAHGIIDDWVITSGLKYTITRPSSFMQNYASVFGNSIKQGAVYSAAGKGKSAWIDVRDIAEVNAEIIKNPIAYKNKVYTLTGNEVFSTVEGLQKISDIIKRPIQYVEVPQQAVNETMKQYGMSEKVVEMIASMDEATRKGYFAKASHDLEKILHRQPISFRDYVKENQQNWN